MGPIYGACCLTGIIWPPDREKRFIFNDVGEIDKAKQLIVGLPAKICTPNVRTNDSYRINDSNPNHIFFYRWPIDKKISVDIAIEYEKHAISINYYWVGEINDDNLGEINSYYESKNSSLYNQIIVIKRFEKNVLSSLQYHSDTNFYQDCYNYMKIRLFYLSIWFDYVFIISLVLGTVLTIIATVKKRAHRQKNI